MPFIDHDSRCILGPIVDELADKVKTPGDLAYVIYRVMNRNAKCWTEYSTWAGTVFLTLLEHFSEKVRPYEDNKKKMNGDVE